MELEFKLLEFEKEFTESNLAHFANDDLVFSADGVDINFASDDNLCAIFWDGLEGHYIRPEHDGRDLGVGIFQGEVEVTGSVWLAVADLTLKPYERERFFEAMLDGVAQLRNGQDRMVLRRC